MLLRKWEDIPDHMRCDEVRSYYDILAKKKAQLALKRAFDVIVSAVFLILLLIPMLVIAVWIRMDSPGHVFFRQERVTSYGKRFFIHKFRTMTEDKKKTGSLITVEGDSRITGAGKKLRDKRLDELPQLLDILAGNMSFVGTRPEVPKYVDRYSKEMLATLLLPAGVTSEASIMFKDEAAMLADATDIDAAYVEKILPEKMKYNLNSIKKFSIINDLGVMIKTVISV